MFTAAYKIMDFREAQVLLMIQSVLLMMIGIRLAAAMDSMLKSILRITTLSMGIHK
jgi:hypothetical protein